MHVRPVRMAGAYCLHTACALPAHCCTHPPPSPHSLTPTLTPTLSPTLTPTQELAFIRNTGAVMGAGFGLLQMVLWAWLT